MMRVASGGHGRSTSRLACGAAALLALAVPACGGADGSTTAAVTTVTTVVTAEPTSTLTESSTRADSSPPSSVPSLTSSAETPLSVPRSGEPLGLEDFFNPGTAWQANRYDTAGKSDVQGLASTVEPPCYSVRVQELELRLSNKFKTLTFSVAQADNSESSDLGLTVEILTNGAQAEIRTVPFNQIQEFAVPVASVNAVKLRFSLDAPPSRCEGSVVAVVHDVSVS
jgi:hypothetical protein